MCYLSVVYFASVLLLIKVLQPTFLLTTSRILLVCIRVSPARPQTSKKRPVERVVDTRQHISGPVLGSCLLHELTIVRSVGAWLEGDLQKFSSLV